MYSFKISYRLTPSLLRAHFLAQTITKRSLQTKEILQEEEMLNQTIKNDPNKRCHSGEETESSLLFPVWQPLVDESRNFTGYLYDQGRQFLLEFHQDHHPLQVPCCTHGLSCPRSHLLRQSNRAKIRGYLR